jgi:hypothetical protein
LKRRPIAPACAAISPDASLGGKNEVGLKIEWFIVVPGSIGRSADSVSNGRRRRLWMLARAIAPNDFISDQGEDAEQK